MQKGSNCGGWAIQAKEAFFYRTTYYGGYWCVLLLDISFQFVPRNAVADWG
jgi:hypothetical protein